MKVVILAGGFGTRISEESCLKPKPMIEIGEQPILWHIMKHYSFYGFQDFIICCGYKANVIKDYFYHYSIHHSDLTFDFRSGNDIVFHNNAAEPWKVTLVDTGLHTMTGGRIKRIQPYLDSEPFFLTYGDGVSNVDLKKLLAFHCNHGKLATITAVQPEVRFGKLDLNEKGKVVHFSEKAKEDSDWINAGFMVLNPKVISYIQDDQTIFERQPLEQLANEGELMAYCHSGFWQCMDTIRDKNLLETMLASGKAPWKVWEEHGSFIL